MAFALVGVEYSALNGTEGLRARNAALQQAKDLRAANRVNEALAMLVQIEKVAPGFSRLYQERGHCYVVLGQANAAIEALLVAVRLNPSLPASWDMLAQLFRMKGETERAAHAEQQLAALEKLPPAVIVANNLLLDEDLASAEAVMSDHLSQHPDNVGALRLLARIYFLDGAFDQAERVLSKVLDLADDYHEARLDYAVALLQQRKFKIALGQAERLIGLDPHNRDYLKQYCAACIGLGDFEQTIDIYEQLLDGLAEVGSEVADLRLWRANALKVAGRQAEAIADYKAALIARPAYGVAWFSLANLKTYSFSEDEVAQMRLAESAAEIVSLDRVYLCFALGMALEARGDYAASWHYYARGNSERHKTSTYRAEAVAESVTRLKQTFTREVFSERKGWGNTDPSPIFVLGLPRSGSTLVEQILASHSQIEGTQELTEIGRYMGEQCGRDPSSGLPENPETILTLSAAEICNLGERFLADTQVYRRLGRAYFIDKMPSNFWHIGLIHLMLPNAVIIDVRREPMASGFSNFKQLFGGTNQDFSYRLEDLAQHYRTYLDLMEHWDTVLPGRVLRVHYEDLVANLEQGVRRLLAHCGLSFEPGCLAFHKTQRSVRTPSSEQVRQPIDPAALDQWRHYAAWLGPLEAELGDALIRYRT